VPQEKTAPESQVVSHEEVQTNSNPPSHFTPDNSPFQPIPAKSAKSDLMNGSKPFDQAPSDEPRLNAPNPIVLSATKNHSANIDQLAQRFNHADRSVASGLMNSFDPGSKPNQGDVQSAPATQTQVKFKKSTFHIVSAGDSFYSIAQQYYGDGGYFRALWYFNQINSRVSEDLSIGMEIEIPTAEQLQKDFPNEVPRSKGLPLRSTTHGNSPDSSFRTKQQPNATSNSIQVCSAELEAAEGGQDFDSPAQAFRENNYLTQEGQTLFEIAANELGQASRYLEILEENRECLPDGVSGSTPLPANLTLLLPK
jgi:nucleoid-associated protein YgaU